MLTINDIKMNAKTIFTRQTEESRNANLAILNYIDHLARSSATNIATWDLKTLFGDPTNKKQSLEFIKERGQINQIFFNEATRLKSMPQAQSASITMALRSGLQLVSQEKKKIRIKELEQKIKTEQTNIDRFISDTLKSIAAVTTLKKETFSLQDVNIDDKIIADLEDVLQGGFYELESVRGSTVTFITKNDVINTFVKPSANIDLRVNLGKYKILFDMESLAMMLQPYENNTTVYDKFHPFADSRGKICWGTASLEAGKFLQSFDIKNALLLLAALLSNYSEENGPYVALGSFAQVQAEAAKKKEMEAKKVEATEGAPF